MNRITCHRKNYPSNIDFKFLESYKKPLSLFKVGAFFLVAVFQKETEKILLSLTKTRSKVIKKALVVITLMLVFCGVPAHAFERFVSAADYDFARGLFLNNNFYLAENIFREFVVINPSHELAGNARFMTAESRYYTGRYQEALKSYMDIIEKYPATKNKYSQEICYRISECFFSMKDYENSLKYVNLLFENYPDTYLSKDAFLLKAEAEYLAGKYAEAIESLSGFDKYPDYNHFDYIYFLLGRIYYEKSMSESDARQTDAQEAIRFLSRVKKEFPDSKILKYAEFAKANVLYSLGRYDDAAGLTENLLFEEKDIKFTPFLKYFLAWTYYMKGNYTKSLAMFRDISDPGGKDILQIWAEYKQGLCMEVLGDKKGALAQYQKVMTDYPNTVPAAYARYAVAFHYYKEKDFPEALDNFQELSENYSVDELNRAALWMIADIYIQLEKFQAARETYIKIESAYKDQVYFARYMQAWCLYKEGDFKEALDMYDGVLRANDASASLKVKSLLKIGDTYYEMNRMEEALDYYNQVVIQVEKFPDIASEACSGKGWISYKNDDFKGAFRLFSKAENFAKNPEVKSRAGFMKANSLYSDYNYDAALSVYSDLINNSFAPTAIKTEALYYEAWCYYRKEQFDTAASLWRRYENDSTDRVKKAEARYRIGWSFFRKNDFDRAITEFNFILDNYKETHYLQEALLKIGDSYYNKKEYDNAVKFYTSLVETYPQHYRANEALYGIQWSYYQQGQFDKAIELSKQFVEKYSDSSFTPEIQYRIAEHYYNMKKYETAVSEFGKFIEKYPAHELADNSLYWQGVALFELAKYPEAVEAFNKLLRKYSTTVFADKAIFKIANAYYKLHDYENAVKNYLDFIAKYKDSKFMDQVYFNTAMSYKRQGNIPEARNWYKKLTEEFKESVLFERALMNLAYTYQDGREYDEAIKIFTEVTGIKKEKAAEAQFWIADCYSSKSETATAAENYMKVYTDYPGNEQWFVPALDAAGRIYDSLGSTEKAIDAYKKILKAAKNEKVLETVRKKLELLEEQYNITNPVPALKSSKPVKEKTETEKVK